MYPPLPPETHRHFSVTIQHHPHHTRETRTITLTEPLPPIPPITQHDRQARVTPQRPSRLMKGRMGVRDVALECRINPAFSVRHAHSEVCWLDQRGTSVPRHRVCSRTF